MRRREAVGGSREMIEEGGERRVWRARRRRRGEGVKRLPHLFL